MIAVTFLQSINCNNVLKLSDWFVTFYNFISLIVTREVVQ